MGSRPRAATLGADGAAVDPDGDGNENVKEYTADTDPMDGESYLALTGVTAADGVVVVHWQGGVWATQVAEFTDSLVDTGATWQAIFTNHHPPPPPQTCSTPAPPTPCASTGSRRGDKGERRSRNGVL